MTKIPKISVSTPVHANVQPLSRDEVAALVAERSNRLLRRLRGKLNALRAAGLGGPYAASILDEDDIMASVSRRLDVALANDRFRSCSESELWAYVQGITQRVIQQRLRMGARDLRLFATISDSERNGIAGLAEAELDRLAPLLRGALTDGEWEMLVLRSRGQSGRELAAAVGASETTVRKRGSRVLALVRKVLNVAVVSPPPKI